MHASFRAYVDESGDEGFAFRERYRLYFYAVGYLVERISWLARGKHNPAKWGGDGTVELVFSNRQGMSYGLKVVPKEAVSGWPPAEDLAWLH